MKNILWIAKGKFEGIDIYLPHHAKNSRSDVAESIMDKAKAEGFTGTIDERLKELEWEIVKIEFVEST